MTAESERIRFLVARDGEEAARAWVRRTLEIYRDALRNRSSHATAPEFRPLFEQAVRDFEAWLAQREPGGSERPPPT
jgi:hypothetical protein